MVQPDCGEAPLAAHLGPGFQLPGDVIAMLAFHFTSAGALAGLLPALRAARMAPTQALRAL